MWILLIVTVLGLTACSTDQPSDRDREYSSEESQSIAEAYVTQLSMYRIYEGRNLRLISAMPLRCPSCYAFTYRFDIEPSRLAGVDTIQVSLQVIRGRIDNVNVTEMMTEYTIAENRNFTCTQDEECETPVEYLVRSNCPYTSKCIGGQCAVICPNPDGYAGAVEIVWEDTVNSEQYQTYNGRNLRVLNVTRHGCTTCYLLELQYTLESAKNPSRTEHAIVTANVQDGHITDIVVTQGGPRIVTSAECAREGGRARLGTDCEVLVEDPDTYMNPETICCVQ